MKTNRVLGIVIIVLIIFAVKGCTSNIDNRKLENKIEKLEEQQKEESGGDSKKVIELKKQLDQANSKINELEKEIVQKDDVYLYIKFPSDGNYYKEAYDRIKFYADSTCTIPIEKARFLSPEIDTAKARNGLNVYCLRLDTGEICYCTERPYLITEEKYNELKKNK